MPGVLLRYRTPVQFPEGVETGEKDWIQVADRNTGAVFRIGEARKISCAASGRLIDELTVNG